jgi:NAD+--dinitrogen-reductase ADP-D-ribosyltransferase
MDGLYSQLSNLIGIPTSYFASPAFNLSPSPIHINGVREMYGSLFNAMDKMETAEDAAHIFMEHMRVAFDLNVSPEEGKKKNYRANYLRLLKGWLFDSNRPEGAVMKGWAESRFGLFPLFHQEPITGVNSPAYWAYTMEKMHTRFHNNAINSQFDLLYEFCQYYLDRFGPRKRKFTLYRGTNIGDVTHQVLEKREKKEWVVRNNSLVSYTADVERADEFGDTVLEVEMPFEKILCFPQLLPGALPKSEMEYIVLGGDCLSRVVNVSDTREKKRAR